MIYGGIFKNYETIINQEIPKGYKRKILPAQKIVRGNIERLKGRLELIFVKQ